MRVVCHDIVVPVSDLITTTADVPHVFHNNDVVSETLCKEMQSDLPKWRRSTRLYRLRWIAARPYYMLLPKITKNRVSRNVSHWNMNVSARLHITARRIWRTASSWQHDGFLSSSLCSCCTIIVAATGWACVFEIVSLWHVVSTHYERSTLSQFREMVSSVEFTMWHTARTDQDVKARKMVTWSITDWYLASSVHCFDLCAMLM